MSATRAQAEIWSFFFSSRRRHTRYWRDWSSDVCSSDLPVHDADAVRHRLRVAVRGGGHHGPSAWADLARPTDARHLLRARAQIGRASCRGREEISVVGVSIKKKNKTLATRCASVCNTYM